MKNSFKIFETKTGKKVPIIDGVHLHSSYNPVKEAEGFIEEHEKTLSSSSNILCLGLGFGYHIYQMLFKLNELYKNNFRIIVIEPNEQTFNYCKKFNLLPTQNVTVINSMNLSKIYSDKDLINFLLKKPSVISHPASFNLYKDFFTSFLTYKAPTDIQSLTTHISDQTLRNHLRKLPEHHSLKDAMKFNVNPEKNLTETDHLLIAFNNLDRMSSKNREIYDE